MPAPPLAPASVEEIMLRRKASAALSALRLEQPSRKPPTPEPIWATLQLQRALSVPGLKPPRPRPRDSPFSPQIIDAVAFGRRAPLPNMPTPSPVPNSRTGSSVEYFAMGRPPAAFLAMTDGGGGRRPPRTAPSGVMPPLEHGGLMTPGGASAYHGLGTPAGGRRGPMTATPSGRRGGGSLATAESGLGEVDRGLDERGLASQGSLRAESFRKDGAHSGGGGGGLSARTDDDETELVQLSDGIDDISERLAQVERVTAMLTPEYTVALQGKLQASFKQISETIKIVDDELQDEGQKRQMAAATTLQARMRCFLLRRRFVRCSAAIRAWRSRELQDVSAPLVSWLRQREAIEEAVEQHLAHWGRQHTKALLAAWRKLAVDGLSAKLALDTELRARRHYRLSLQRSVLWAWKRVAHYSNLSEVRWVTRGNRRVALKKHIVDTLESFIRAWRQFVHVSTEAKRRFGACGFRDTSSAFYALRSLVQRRKRLRQLTVTRWRDYGRSIWQLPFRAWYLYMIDQKLLRRVRIMLISSFRRKLLRRLLGQLVQAWRELTKYKAVETRTRSQLLDALKAQESLTAEAETTLEEYAKVLVEAESSLETEARSQAHLARHADDAHTELAALRLKCHSAQQEVLRLRTMLRHYELRYPRAAVIMSTEAPSAKGGGAARAKAAHDDAVPDTTHDDAPPPPPPRLPPPPLIVEEEEMKSTQRLSVSANALLATSTYAPPADGGTMADRELRRVRALLEFVLSGAVPEDAPLELRDIAQESTVQIQRRLAEATSRLYSDDGSEVRPLQTPAQLLNAAAMEPPGDASKAEDAAAAAVMGGERERNLLLAGLEFHTTEEDGLGGVDMRPALESGAEQLAQRVAARREELQTRMARHRVNLYAPKAEQLVMTIEEEEEANADGSLGAGGEFAQALIGF